MLGASRADPGGLNPSRRTIGLRTAPRGAQLRCPRLPRGAPALLPGSRVKSKSRAPTLHTAVSGPRNPQRGLYLGVLHSPTPRFPLRWGVPGLVGVLCRPVRAERALLGFPDARGSRSPNISATSVRPRICRNLDLTRKLAGCLCPDGRRTLVPGLVGCRGPQCPRAEASLST